MTAEPVELPNAADDRVIEACLKLIEAGRPVSEIIDNAKRVSAMPLAPEKKSGQHSSIVPASRKIPRTWLLGAAILFGAGAGAAGTEYLPRFAAGASVVPMASAPIPLGSRDTNPTPLGSAEVEALLDRGSMLFGAGDLAGARTLYKRAAEAGDARAANYLASTYDPFFLKQARFGKTVHGDLHTAAYWYQRARDFLSSEQKGG